MQSHLIYHYTAVRYRKLWSPFVSSLDKLLLSKISPSKKIVLIGGSACACLTDAFLDQFQEIIIYDKDPMAPVLFRVFHGLKYKPKYFIEDAFSFDGIKLDAKRTRSILEQHQPDQVLFANIIGQLPIYYKKFFKTQDYIAWSQDLDEVLKSYKAASFHDVVSFKKADILNKMPDQITIEPQDNIASLADKFSFPQTIFDHLVLEQKWSRPSVSLRWDLSPNSIHYVEVCF